MTKWCAAIYLMTTDQGGLSAERLRKMIGVCWRRSAQRMLDQLRATMADRDFDYLLTGMVEVDDCMVGGKSRQGQRGRNQVRQGYQRVSPRAVVAPTPEGGSVVVDPVRRSDGASGRHAGSAGRIAGGIGVAGAAVAIVLVHTCSVRLQWHGGTCFSR